MRFEISNEIFKKNSLKNFTQKHHFFGLPKPCKITIPRNKRRARDDSRRLSLRLDARLTLAPFFVP